MVLLLELGENGNRGETTRDQSWRSVLLVEETGGPGENHRPVASQ